MKHSAQYPKSGKKSSKASRKRDALIVAMLQHPTLEKAAQGIGMSTSTAYRIRQTPEFEEQFRSARKQAVSDVMARLPHMSAVATSVLMKAMIDPQAPYAVRVRAAESAIRNTQSFMEKEDFDVRLHQVEKVIAKMGGEQTTSESHEQAG